jgi:2-hydroxychromene-2-carboxylate isomerase
MPGLEEGQSQAPRTMPRVSFYFDLGSPYAYLAAERLDTLLAEPVEWQPILLGGLFKATGRSSWALGEDRRRQAGMAEVERRARDYGLGQMRWPDPWPTNYLTAMLATTFAFTVGRGRELTRQAFRNAFQKGWDLSVPDRVFETGCQAGLDRGELEAATQDPEIKQALRSATDAAFERGVIGVPTLAIDDELFWGDDRLEDAAAYLANVTPGA